MTKGIDGYIKGKLAGMIYYRALAQSADAKPPANPFPSSEYQAYVEWNNGFGDGFADGALCTARKVA
jgi:hypothetical protein